MNARLEKNKPARKIIVKIKAVNHEHGHEYGHKECARENALWSAKRSCLRTRSLSAAITTIPFSPRELHSSLKHVTRFDLILFVIPNPRLKK